MKKISLLNLVVLVLLSTQVLASQSVFNPLDNTLTLDCLRIQQGEQIGTGCYPVKLKLEDSGFLSIVSISGPGSSSEDSQDPIFIADTAQVNLPRIMIGRDVYSASLAYNAESRLLSINSVTYLRTENPSVTETGVCDLNSSPIFNALGAGACFSYGTGTDAARAEQACTSFGGTWSANSTCPENFIGACAKTDTINDISFMEYYYDLGIVEMYNTASRISEQMGIPYAGPTPEAMLLDYCDSDGGVWF